jgi:hypothetical protein
MMEKDQHKLQAVARPIAHLVMHSSDIKFLDESYEGHLCRDILTVEYKRVRFRITIEKETL